ncbi:MAG: GNAT family N-acetyltransferase [Peptostreptococcus sp.]|uniref:GNAT family N-acetyltransferase n=1 Tax=Peptostreptococcus sp. TaxID=1262 RepID=UPI002FC5A546
MNITYKIFKKNDTKDNMLDNFDRYQDVKYCWRKVDGIWKLKNIEFIEQWDEKEKLEIIESLRETVSNKGFVYVALLDDKLLGFSSVESNLIGSKKQYAVLHHIYVSKEFRGQNIGKNLFDKSCEFARNIGASLLYISAHSSEESQLFYRKMSCVDAKEIDKELFELEPCDRHLEFDLHKK